MLRMIVFFLFTTFGFQTLAQTQPKPQPSPPPVPRQTKPCCRENRDPIVREIDKRLVGVWEIQTDWTCEGSEVSQLKSIPDQRLWILNEDGTCSDSLGNTCTWRAENGRILVEFLERELHFQGTYRDDQRFSGYIFDESCAKGCLTAIRKVEPMPAPPTRRQPADKYGLSKTSSLDMGLVDKAVYIHAGNCPADRAVLFLSDGSCIASGGNIPNSCRWSAKTGRIEITIGNHRFTGRYNGLGQLHGAMENLKQCGNDCLPPADPPPGRYPQSPTQNPTQGGGGPLLLPGGGSTPPVIFDPFRPGGGCYQSCVSPN